MATKKETTKKPAAKKAAAPKKTTHGWSPSKGRSAAVTTMPCGRSDS